MGKEISSRGPKCKCERRERGEIEEIAEMGNGGKGNAMFTAKNGQDL
jgi:hypothetical protein